MRSEPDRSRARFPPSHGGRGARPFFAAVGLSKLQSLGCCKAFEPLTDGNAANGLLEAGQKLGFSLAAIQIEQQRLHRAYCGGRKREVSITENRQRQCANRLRCK